MCSPHVGVSEEAGGSLCLAAAPLCPSALRQEAAPGMLRPTSTPPTSLPRLCRIPDRGHTPP